MATPIHYRLRTAALSDIPALRLLIDASVRALHTQYYTPAQIAGALKTVYGVDTQLILDGNYFVVETLPPASSSIPNVQSDITPFQPAIIACGGWSYRSTLYGGDQYDARDDNRLDPEKDAAKIRAFFVHPEWARKGIGGVVLEACEDAARRAGFRSAEMGATLSGVPFYGRKGYVEIGNGKVMQSIGGGIMLELVRMEKMLV